MKMIGNSDGAEVMIMNLIRMMLLAVIMTTDYDGDVLARGHACWRKYDCIAKMTAVVVTMATMMLIMIKMYDGIVGA